MYGIIALKASTNTKRKFFMDITVSERGDSRIAVISGDSHEIRGAQEALDLIATAYHMHGCAKLLVPKSLMPEEFFDLRTGLAGEILQKFTNYRVQCAFVGDFGMYESGPMHDFIYESNRVGRMMFLPSEQEALDRLHAGK